MGYKVRILPKDSAEGWLSQGRKTSTPTYYPHPGLALVAASGYLRKHPADTCQVVTWSDEALVEEVISSPNQPIRKYNFTSFRF